MKPAVKLRSAPLVSDGEHLIGAYTGDAAGPTLIIVGSIHGNEPAGVKALLNVSETLAEMQEDMRGRVYLIAGNTRSLTLGVRFIDRDLNRAWTREDMASVGTPSLMELSEGRELTEIDRLLDSILITATNEVYVLDLHSTSADGLPFATVGDTLRNRKFALTFPVTIILGIEEQLEGTMLEYLNNAGAVTLGFEGGQHDSPVTVENHTSLAWLALVNTGILSAADVPDLELHRARLAAEKHAPQVVEVRHREAVTADDGFKMNPGFNNFDSVTQGQIVAKNHRGPVKAPEDGMILMPLYQKLGEDGFFIGRAISPFWLKVSEVLRRLKIQDYVYWLPGVARDEHDYETLIIDTRVARLFPLQVFHLLGFRRRRWSGNKLVVSRRRHDTKSPFTG